MTEPKETKEAQEQKPQTQPFDGDAFDKLSAEFRKAPSPEARAKLLSERKDLVRAGVRLSREMERSTLPMYAKACHKASENSIYDKAVLVKDIGVLAILGVAAYKGGLKVWEYFHT